MKSELQEYNEKLKDDDPKKIICEVLCRLSSNLEKNEIFLSEADFQFSFAQELDKVLREEKRIKSPKIILEYPFLTKELYSEDDITEGDTRYSNRMCIDLYYEYEGKAVYIEFKYKTKGISGVKRGSSNKFTLQNHSNVTEQRQGLYKDIERIEHCLKWHKKNSKIKCFGYVVFITNNKSHWDKESKARKYRLCDEIACKCEITQKDEYVCTTKNHKLTWHPFTTENQENKQFKVCLIDCNNAE